MKLDKTSSGVGRWMKYHQNAPPVEVEPERVCECQKCMCYAETEDQTLALCFNCNGGFHYAEMTDAAETDE